MQRFYNQYEVFNLLIEVYDIWLVRSRLLNYFISLSNSIANLGSKEGYSNIGLRILVCLLCLIEDSSTKRPQKSQGIIAFVYRIPNKLPREVRLKELV